jgi:hypothetical protein
MCFFTTPVWVVYLLATSISPDVGGYGGTTKKPASRRIDLRALVRLTNKIRAELMVW